MALGSNTSGSSLNSNIQNWTNLLQCRQKKHAGTGQIIEDVDMVIAAHMNTMHNITKATYARDSIKGKNRASQIAIDGHLGTNGTFQDLDISTTPIMQAKNESTGRERHRLALGQQIPPQAFIHK